jgi:hypothetical protein
MSSIFIPDRFRIFFVTGTGPVSIIVGSVPIFSEAKTRARGFKPDFIPNSLDPIKVAEEPSTIPLEFPAW